MTLNHSTATEGHWAHRYAYGQLSNSEREQFEIHLIECRRCQDDVDETAMLRSGFQTAAQQDPTLFQRPSWPRSVRFALAASVALFAGAGLLSWRAVTGVSDAASVAAVGGPQRVVRLAAFRSSPSEIDVEIERSGASGEIWLLDVEVDVSCPDGSAPPLCADGTEAVAAADSYRLSLRGVGTASSSVLEIGPAAPLPSGDVIFAVPAAALSAGDYEAVITAQGSSEPRIFRVRVR
jgi:anti-sigma factor RsiW